MKTNYSFYEGYVESASKAWWIKLTYAYRFEGLGGPAYFVLDSARYIKFAVNRKRKLILYEDY